MCLKRDAFRKRVVVGKGTKVLINWSAQGLCPPHRGRWSWWLGGKTGRYERRWKARRGKWTSRGESNTQHECMEMIHGMWCAHTKLTTWATRVLVIRCQSTRKCDVWGVLFTSPVGSSRLLSSVNDLTTPKNLTKCHIWAALCHSFYDAAHFTSSEVLDFWLIMNSTMNRSTATKMCWMKKTMNAISGIARKDSVRVALLQTHSEDGAISLMLRWSLNGVSSVHCVQMCWERSTNSLCIWSTRLASYDKWIFLRVPVYRDAYFFLSINSELCRGNRPCTSYSRTIYNSKMATDGYYIAYTFTHNNITLEHNAMNNMNTITHMDVHNTQYWAHCAPFIDAH